MRIYPKLTETSCGHSPYYAHRFCRSCYDRSRLPLNRVRYAESRKAWRIAHPVSATKITWVNMLRRCLDPNATAFKHYGGRGIAVCDRWSPKAGGSFENFLADMGYRGDEQRIERIDNDGNYEPGNCRWATQAEQVANRRPLAKPTHCKRGHEFTAGNTISRANGRRHCRTCERARPKRAPNPLTQHRALQKLYAQGLTARGTPRKRSARSRITGELL